MKILVFTAKWIGLKCVEHLLDNFPGDDYTFVVGEPDSESIVKELKRRGHSCLLLNKDTVESIADSALHYDWLLNLWGGFIFKKNILDKVTASLNIHPAYLPYCRGRDPIVWAIRYGFPAGVTLHEINTGVDEGAIIYQEEVPYSLPIRGAELYEDVVEKAVKVFREKWEFIRNGALRCTDAQPASPEFKTFKRSDLLLDRSIDLDNSKELREFFLKLLAHDFSEGYSAEIVFDNKKYSARLLLKEI